MWFFISLVTTSARGAQPKLLYLGDIAIGENFLTLKYVLAACLSRKWLQNTWGTSLTLDRAWLAVPALAVATVGCCSPMRTIRTRLLQPGANKKTSESVEIRRNLGWLCQPVANNDCQCIDAKYKGCFSQWHDICSLPCACHPTSNTNACT